MKLHIHYTYHYLATLLIILIIAGAFYFSRDYVTGYVSYYYAPDMEKSLSVFADKSTAYNLDLKSASVLKSIKLSGNVEGEGRARVYVKRGSDIFLIFDSAALASKSTYDFVTGFAVAEGESSSESGSAEASESSEQAGAIDSSPESSESAEISEESAEQAEVAADSTTPSESSEQTSEVEISESQQGSSEPEPTETIELPPAEDFETKGKQGKACEDGETKACEEDGYAGTQTCSGGAWKKCVLDPYCGDSEVNGDEECEGSQTQDCEETGYSGTQTCSNCLWEDCVLDPYCGDGEVNGDEACEPEQIQSCTLNGKQGSQTCTVNCAWGACDIVCEAACEPWADTCDTERTCTFANCTIYIETKIPENCCNETCEDWSGVCDTERTCTYQNCTTYIETKIAPESCNLPSMETSVQSAPSTPAEPHGLMHPEGAFRASPQIVEQSVPLFSAPMLPQTVTFVNACQQTCVIPASPKKEKYSLVVDITGDAVVRLNKVKYRVA